MKKAIIFVLLVIIIAAQWTFLNSSFYILGANGGSISGTSAVIIAKANYLSARVMIHITIRAPGSSRLIVHFQNGTQEEVMAGMHHFEVFLPKSGPFIGSFTANAPGGILLNDIKPIGSTVVSNTTEDFFAKELNTEPSDMFAIYWLRCEGQAIVSVSGIGVTV